MKTITSLIILFSFSLNLNAQEDVLKKIRARYAEVNDENEFYQSRILQLNTMQAAIGLQTTTIEYLYWYEQEDPEIDPYKLVYGVAKVSVDYNISDGMRYRIEYLFDDSQNLIFYYKKAEGLWENYQYRYYFNKGKLIKVIIESINEMGLKLDYTNTVSFKEKDLKYAADCIAKAKEYKSFFDAMTDIEFLDK